jgi:tetratricopeptide (TPR) repeat protein
MGEGFVLAAHFAEQLAAYEKQEQSMRFYFPELIAGIDLRKEAVRLEKLEFNRKPEDRLAKPVAAPPPPEPSAIEQALEIAEEHYRNRALDQATETFGRVLQMQAPKPLHAKAYYGLGRVSALRKDPDSAEKFFLKALESDPPVLERAWTLVYLGRLADASNQPDVAAQRYREALALEGASDGARQAAEKALQSRVQ